MCTPATNRFKIKMDCLQKTPLSVIVIVVMLSICVQYTAAGGDGNREHVHLKIHIPKIIKKHTHVQTIYKHLLQKVPVLEESEEDGYKDGSEKYLRIDPKITLRPTNSYGGGGRGNELRSIQWAPHYNYENKELESTFSSPLAFKSLKRYPKNVRGVHEYEDYVHKPKLHRIIKHVIPTYEIQEDINNDYDPSSHEEYGDARPKKSYLKSQSSQTLKFIPASEVSQYIPTIPLSSLTAAQSQYTPVWTPLSNRPAKNKDRQTRSSSRYEGTTMRVYSNDGSTSFSTPMIPSYGRHILEKRFQMNF